MRNLTRALGQAADGAFITDQDQRILYWNRAAEELLGHTSARTIGRPCHEVLEGCDRRDRLICRPECDIVAAAQAGEVVSDYDLRVRTAAGRRRWINISTLIFSREGNGACPLLVHLFRDATTRVRNERFIERVLQATARLQSAALVASAPPAAGLGTELTPRERQVLSLLAEGLGTQEIADRLSISSFTVRNHVRNILSKFHVHSRLEAVVYALQHGLVAKR